MKNTLFGTDGIRGAVGSPPFTPESLLHLGNAIGQWATQRYGADHRILIAHDTRISASFVKSCLLSGLLPHTFTVYDAHILPTPAVYKLIAHASYAYGIILSASHNPYHDNGIKLIDAASGKLSAYDEECITNLFNEQKYFSATSYGSLACWHEAGNEYYKLLHRYFSPSFLQGITVILDCAHGATSQIAPAIFAHFGAQVITINNTPNGTNINDQCGALFPASLQQKVCTEQADIGFAFDGDGDRVVAVTKNGEIKNGDDMLAFLLHHPRYKNEQTIVGTIMSNQGLSLALEQEQRKIIRTHVGDKYVLTAMEDNNSMLGGEPSGHIIMRDYAPTGDGIFTALRLLETILITGNWHMQTFAKFPQIMINVPISYKKELTDPHIVDLIATYEAQLSPGRLIVRYSGTEPKLRIMAEHEDEYKTRHLVTQLAEKLHKLLT